MRTRRTNKEVNKKQLAMCEKLNRAESRRVRPDIEGELPDMPVLEVDEDFEQDKGGKRGAKGKKDITTPEAAEFEKKKAQVSNLFVKFGLAELLKGIEEAETKDNFDKMIEFSSKLQFLFKLLENFKQEGKRVLIFSMSKKMLTIIEKIIKRDQVTYMRIDGDTEISSREQMCNDFNADPSIFCALLTTKVGG